MSSNLFQSNVHITKYFMPFKNVNKKEQKLFCKQKAKRRLQMLTGSILHLQFTYAIFES